MDTLDNTHTHICDNLLQQTQELIQTYNTLPQTWLKTSILT